MLIRQDQYLIRCVVFQETRYAKDFVFRQTMSGVDEVG